MKNGQLEEFGTCAKEVYFKWTIDDFEELVYSENSISSPGFQIMLLSDCTKWEIELYPGYGYGAFPEAKIVLVEAKHAKIVVDVEFRLFNSRGENFDSLDLIGAEMSSGTSVKSSSKIYWSDTKILDKIFHDNQVTVFIHLKAFLNNHPALINELPISNYVSKSISDDFATLRKNKEFSDLTISVCGKEFHAHKNILAARSPVFAAMFKNEMKEANSGKVEIEDIEPEIFEEFLNFIYTGKGNIVNACELLAAANKYDVGDLKAVCENELIKNLSQENCYESLNLSDIYSANSLKKEAMKLIVSYDCVMDKNGLAEITNLSLLKELIKALQMK